MKKILLATFLIAASASAVEAQQKPTLKLPALSTTSKTVQDFSTGSIELTYSRPSARGRKVFGELVPYGANWRTGANSNTKIKFSEDVIIGGKRVKAGEYSLYSVPTEGDWTIILNSSTANWGTMGYDKAKDVARFKAASYYLNAKVETYTMQFTNISYDKCNLELTWEYTKVVIPIEADNEAQIAKNIKKALNGKKDAPYFQVANYYNERNENLDKAYEYVNKAIKDNPKAYYMYYLKARIAQKLDMVDEAIQAANKSIEVAKGTPNEAEYRRVNMKIIRELE
ncbi:MAG: DUF2911 domain-containing protein [Flavipsychrobacter sp.]|nr:DUF2911 domain-containing protein [Flavipsychrobacter sp.]